MFKKSSTRVPAPVIAEPSGKHNAIFLAIVVILGKDSNKKLSFTTKRVKTFISEIWNVWKNKKSRLGNDGTERARYEARTRDPDLGKVVLYQLS